MLGPDGVHKRDIRGDFLTNGFIRSDSPFDKKHVEVENKLAVLGLERDWSLKKDFKRRKMPELFKPDDPQSKEYLPSIQKLNIGHIQEYLDKKKEARQDLLEKGKVEDEYLGFINKPPRQLKPSHLKIFPAVGMINNKQTYTTTRHVDERSIQALPLGLDEFTNN